MPASRSPPRRTTWPSSTRGTVNSVRSASSSRSIRTTTPRRCDWPGRSTRRPPVYRAPDWVTDPFAAAGLTVDPPKPNPLVAGRFLILRTLHYSPRGAIHLALDIEAATPCVLKQAHKHAHVREDGADARDAL